SGAMMLPVRWLANADGRNAAERIKQANAENCIFFIISDSLLLNLFFTESRSDQSGDAFQRLPAQLNLRLEKEHRSRSREYHRHRHPDLRRQRHQKKVISPGQGARG